MKTATLPTVRVLPEVRSQAEALLQEGESLSMFIEESLRRQIALRQAEREFLARGIAAGQKMRESGIAIEAAESIARLKNLTPTRTATARS